MANLIIDCPERCDYSIYLSRLGFVTISIDVHRTGIPFSIVVSVYLSRVVFIWTVVAAVADFILVKVKLTGIVKQGTVVLLQEDYGC